ncbi:MAG: hypothetical protein OK456_03335 [Thaumarchaeota archaeon]|nr:hypothetical protein [Nitrososphaerota archaeon]
MRRLVVLSILLILAGLALLLPSSALYSLLTKGTTSTATSAAVRFGAVASSSSSDNTTTIESLVGFGLIGVAAVLELLSLVTDVGVATPTRTGSQVEVVPPGPETPAPASTAAPAATKSGEKA